VSLKLGDKVMLKDFSYEFCRGDKIGIVGFNGMGKSTFIRVISGQQQRNAYLSLDRVTEHVMAVPNKLFGLQETGH
jgi:ATPase subunit of ABC transporter with duplicated ATPase domains